MKLKFYRLYPPSTLPISATSLIKFLSCQLFMPHFQAMVFIKIVLKLSPFCKKYTIFQRLGALPQTSNASGCSSPIRPLKQTLITDFWLRAWLRYFNDTTLVCWCLCEFQIPSKYRNITTNLETHQTIITNFGRRIVRFWKWRLFLSKTKNSSNLTCLSILVTRRERLLYFAPFILHAV